MVRFKISPDEVIRHLGGVVDFDADGQPMNAGKPLGERLRDFASINPMSIAGSISEVHDAGQSSIRAKSDLKSDKEKSDFISKNGFAKFSALPAVRQETREIPIDELQWSDWQKLSDREKSRIIGERGSAFVARLKYADGERERNDRLVGVPRGVRR